MGPLPTGRAANRTSEGNQGRSKRSGLTYRIPKTVEEGGLPQSDFSIARATCLHADTPRYQHMTKHARVAMIAALEDNPLTPENIAIELSSTAQSVSERLNRSRKVP